MNQATPMPRAAVEALDAAAWDRLTEGLAGRNLLQTGAYGEAKAATGPWRVERVVLRQDDAVVGAAQVLVRTLPAGLGGLAWINRGPLWQASRVPDGARIAMLLRPMRVLYGADRGLYLRLAPAVESGAMDGAVLDAAGMRPAGAAGWASARLDLAPPLDALRGVLKQKWRNALNKAERAGLQVTVATDDDAFGIVLTGYDRFLAERGFATTVSPGFLRALRTAGPDTAFLEAAIAWHDGEPVGGAVLAHYGDTTEYLVGTATDAGRRLNAGQILLWQAVQAAQARGRRWFDLGGVDPDLTPEGILHFKQGLGGTPYRLADELEAMPGFGPRHLAARLVRWRVRAARAAV